MKHASPPIVIQAETMSLVATKCQTAQEAERSVQALQDAGFSPQSIFVCNEDGDRSPCVPVQQTRHPIKIAPWGALVGLLGGLSAGIAAMMDSGSIASLVGYAAGGTVLGAIVGVVVGFVRWRSRPQSPAWLPFNPPFTVEVEVEPDQVGRANEALHEAASSTT